MYNIGDVLILTDAFETFRNTCLRADVYGLDPAHYISAPHLSWDAMLKTTNQKLELISDPAMYRMLDANMRGGVCMISKRYAKANNKYMRELYDPNQPSQYILYLDANNLYGWAMSQSLPIKNFTWIDPEEWQAINWLEQTQHQTTGYFIECDLEYPPELHDKHNDLPLAPRKEAVTFNMLSNKQVEVSRHYNVARSHTSVKLLPSLMSKTKYTVHYLNLKFYLEQGLKLNKIHRVIKFTQEPWLKSYIDTNSQLRKDATNEFEKGFYKLMNNAVYGKTCENLRKRVDIKLENDRNKAQVLINQPNCIDIRRFTDDLVGIEMRKTKLEINKPFYVGFAVLELSKLHMYRYAHS